MQIHWTKVECTEAQGRWIQVVKLCEEVLLTLDMF